MNLTNKMIEELRERFPHDARLQYRDGEPIGRRCYPDCDLCLIERILHLTSTRVDYNDEVPQVR